MIIFISDGDFCLGLGSLQNTLNFTCPTFTTHLHNTLYLAPDAQATV